MKWSSGIPIFCLLALVLSCESTSLKLKSVNDLKKIDFGRSVPKHSLLLLHWFANIINIDNNDVLLLTFDPNEDFGSHHYGNYEDMLDPLPRGYRYYTVGNLHEDTSSSLPAYVLQPPVREYEGNNMDRIIFRVQERSSRASRIDRVYLTQHYRQHEHQGKRYNPDLTYHISTTLLHEIRQLSLDNRGIQGELRDTRASLLGEVSHTWGEELMCLGLLLCIVIQEKYSANMTPQQLQSDQNDLKPEEESDKLAQSHSALNVSNDNNGNNISNLTGKNEWPQAEQGVTLALIDKSQRNQTGDNCMLTSMHDGATNSSKTQNGLQNREQDATDTYYVIIALFIELIVMCAVMCAVMYAVYFILKTNNYFEKKGQEVCQHPHPGRVQILGYDAHLEITAKQHKACARLYVEQDFRQWRSEFEHSWVGFYESAEKDTSQYVWGQWQWATKFMSCSDYDDYNGHCLEYCSGMKAASGVQARFILKHTREIAHTPGFQSPGGVEITGYNARLQFFVQNGKACARLYVRKSFWHWRSEFKNSWLGFYKSASAGTREYEWFQWATKVKQCHESWWEYLIFEYCSGLQANPGVHVRFILKDSIEIARTPNWQYFN